MMPTALQSTLQAMPRDELAIQTNSISQYLPNDLDKFTH